METQTQSWHWPVLGWLCQAAPAHQHSPHLLLSTLAKFCCPGLQASDPHSKLAEKDTTTGSRHIMQGPCFQKYSNCLRSLCVFQSWKLPVLILRCKSTNEQGKAQLTCLHLYCAGKQANHFLYSSYFLAKINPSPISGRRNEKATEVMKRLSYTE